MKTTISVFALILTILFPFSLFAENDKAAEEVEQIQSYIEDNNLNWTAGLTTRMTEMTLEERRASNGVILPDGWEKIWEANFKEDFIKLNPDDLPPTFNWADSGKVTPVRNQGGCGSCWDFAATAAFEAIYKIQRQVDLDFAEQQVLSCYSGGWGCDGGVVIALLQGFLGGLLFLIVGISSPVLWGSVMAILAFIPVVGPSLIYIPTGIILIATGSTVKGILIIAIGLGISQTDNFIRPILFAGKSQTHTLMLFFSIMGGIAMFGLLGIVLGPFIAALFLTLLKMFELQLHPDDVKIITTGDQ